MFKNTAAKFMVFAFDTTTNTAKTGDAANITAYVTKDYGTVTVLADTSATEMDSTNAKGYYLFDAAQGETNGDCLMISAKSTTANIAVIGAPAVIYTRPTTGWLAPTTAARTLDVSAGGEAGVDWANVGSPTTAVDLSGTTIKTTQKVDVDTIKTNPVANGGTVTFPTNATLASTTNLTAGTIATVTNQLTAAQIATGIWQDTTAGDFTTSASIGKSIMNGVALGTGLTINAYTGNTPQTGDSYARIGAAGVGLTNLGDTRIANLDATVSSRLATSGYTAPLDAAGTRSAMGLASANLDTQISLLSTAANLATLQTSATAIKAKTDSLTFTQAGNVDANIQYVNDTQVNGVGSVGSPWGP